MDLESVKVIVFDLDGTLYEDTHQFDYYAKRLSLKLPEAIQDEFYKDWALANKQQHTLQVGSVYDIEKDLILRLNSSFIVEEGYYWDGTKLSQEQVKQLYLGKPVTDYSNYLTVGDFWLVAVTIARHHGVPSDQTYEAFYETREYMMGPDYSMKEIKGFRETFQALSNSIPLILLTNSPQTDSEAILDKIGIRDLFQRKIFTGKKPYQSIDHFQSIQKIFKVPYSSILSIGDNWLNEIKPAQELGCQTVYIDPFHLGHYADVRVHNLEELTSILKKLIRVV